MLLRKRLLKKLRKLHDKKPGKRNRIENQKQQNKQIVITKMIILHKEIQLIKIKISITMIIMIILILQGLDVFIAP